MDEVVYDALSSGGYFADGIFGLIVLAAASLGVVAGVILLIAGARRTVSRGPKIAVGLVLAVGCAGGIAAVEYDRLRDSRDIPAGRYTVMTGTVLVVSPQSISVDKVQFATPCRPEDAKSCARAAGGDRVRIAYRGLDVTDNGPRALRIWRLPPPAEPVSEADPAADTYAPPEAARKTPVSPTTRSSGGLTIRLIPGRLGQ